MKRIDPAELHTLIQTCSPNIEGWVRTKDVVKTICDRLHCTIPTAYANLHVLQYAVEQEWGKIRTRKYEEGLPNPGYAQELAQKLSTLDDLTAYLVTLPHTIQVDEFLVLIETIREEIKNGVDTKIEELRLRLEQVFHVVLEDAVKKGQAIRTTGQKRTEEPEQVFRVEAKTGSAQGSEATQTS
jgi:hypothetical protein